MEKPLAIMNRNQCFGSYEAKYFLKAYALEKKYLFKSNYIYELNTIQTLF